MEKVSNQPDKTWFFQQLRQVLNSLYDVSSLANSPLMSLFKTNQQGDTILNLRNILIEAIESFKGFENLPRDSKSYRIYLILRQRFIEQQTQRNVSENIGLSIRQLQREEKNAIAMLGETLWVTHRFGEKIQSTFELPLEVPEHNVLGGGWLPVNGQDWVGFKNTIPVQPVDISKLVQDAIDTLKDVLESAHVKMNCIGKDNSNRLFLQAPILRQGLLNIIDSTIELAPGGKIQIQTIAQHGQARILIEGLPMSGALLPLNAKIRENLEIAEKLIRLCGGSLEINTHELAEVHHPDTGKLVFSATVILSSAERAIVLVVEDHADTLHLYQRYLATSPYHFIGASDSQQALLLAVEMSPKIIVLDVMMPKSDGWALLGQLHVHPRT